MEKRGWLLGWLLAGGGGGLQGCDVRATLTEMRVIGMCLGWAEEKRVTI